MPSLGVRSPCTDESVSLITDIISFITEMGVADVSWALSCFEQRIHKFSAYKSVPKPIILLWPACASYTGAVLFKVIPPNGASKRPIVSD